MTSPYYPGGNPYQQYTTQGGGGMDQDALAAMYEQTGQFNQQEADRKYKLGKDEIQARMKIAGMQSGDTRYGIEQTRDAARETLEQARQQMIQIGIPQMLINKYVAEKTYEIAASEMQLKRDTLTQDTAQKAAQLQLDREQMERVGIPKMEIDRYVAQSNAEVARGRLGLDTRTAEQQFGLAQAGVTGYYGGQQTLEQRKFLADQQAAAQAAAQHAREFQTTASGYLQQAPALTAGQQSRYQQLQARDEQIRASGGPGIDPSERTELAGYQDILSGRAPNPEQPGGGGGGQATLDRERFMQDQLEQARRYGLDVSKFGAELASTPDTYFQARRFQGVDVPRLLGGAGAATQDVAGGPTPGVATMGAYLSGQDPYGQQAQAAAAAAGAPAAAPGAPAAPAGPAAQPLSAQEQARYQQLVARDAQLRAAGEPPLSGVDLDELKGYIGRGAPPPSAAPAGPSAAPLSGQEQARWQQLMARDQEIRASGGPGLEGADLDEAQRFQQRGATYSPPAAAAPPPGGYQPTGGYGIAPPAPYGAPGRDYGLGAPGRDYGLGAPGGGGYGGPAGGAGTGGGPIDQYGNPIGGSGGGMPGWYTGGGVGQPFGGMGGAGAGGGPIDQYGNPIGGGDGMMYAGGGGAWNEGGMGYGGDPAAFKQQRMGGGGPFPNIDPVSGGSTLPPSAFGGSITNTTSSYGATPYGGSSVNASQGYASAMPSWYTQQYGSGGSGQGSQYPSQDPRQKQVAALAKAMPPSPYQGLNEADSAALKAMEAIYKGGGNQIAGGEWERLKSSGRMGFLSSAGKLLGYSPSDLESQYQSYRPSQGSSRLAG